MNNYTSIDAWNIHTSIPYNGIRSPRFWQPIGQINLMPGQWTIIVPVQYGRHEISILNNSNEVVLLTNNPNSSAAPVIVYPNQTFTLPTEDAVYAQQNSASVITIQAIVTFYQMKLVPADETTLYVPYIANALKE